MTAESVTITLTLEEAHGFHHTGFASKGLRGRMDRFECSDPEAPAEVHEPDADPAQLFDLPAFDNGSLLHCDGYAGALLLAKVHRGLGYTAYVLYDMAEVRPGQPLGHCVLTSWSLMDQVVQA